MQKFAPGTAQDLLIRNTVAAKVGRMEVCKQKSSVICGGQGHPILDSTTLRTNSNNKKFSDENTTTK